MTIQQSTIDKVNEARDNMTSYDIAKAYNIWSREEQPVSTRLRSYYEYSEDVGQWRVTNSDDTTLTAPRIKLQLMNNIQGLFCDEIILLMNSKYTDYDNELDNDLKHQYYVEWRGYKELICKIRCEGIFNVVSMLKNISNY